MDTPPPASRSHSIVLRFDEPAQTGARSVVYLHGRGSSEREAGRMVQAFRGASVRAYRGPLRQGGGHAWFENQGIGVARRDSLEPELIKVGEWIGTDNGSALPWLCGFSNGAAMAAHLALATPHAYAGLLMIGGCFALGALPANRLQSMPVLFCQGRHDGVIPEEKFSEARNYLAQHSAADLYTIDYAGGHEITDDLIDAVGHWFASRPA